MCSILSLTQKAMSESLLGSQRDFPYIVMQRCVSFKSSVSLHLPLVKMCDCSVIPKH